MKKKKSKPPYISRTFLRNFITSALAEDEGNGDHTSRACISPRKISRAQLIIKEKGILAGVDLAREIFYQIDPSISFKELLQDGAKVRKGMIAFTVHGNAINILLAERLVLNVMQRMSGIATATNKYVELCKETKTLILDTRKTTPNFRFAEKWAVLIGGGNNHRFGLYDMILVKDNHIDIGGGISGAIASVKRYLKHLPKKVEIEVEARTLADVKEILAARGVHRILLDNMPVEMMAKAVKLIGKQAQTEASGGITEHTIRKVAKTGVDFISVGALTHHIKSLDLSLKAF